MSKKKSKEVEFELVEKPIGTEADYDNETTAATTGGDQEEESKEI